jgi:hypothetical protein
MAHFQQGVGSIGSSKTEAGAGDLFVSQRPDEGGFMTTELETLIR